MKSQSDVNKPVCEAKPVNEASPVYHNELIHEANGHPHVKYLKRKVKTDIERQAT